MSNKDNYVVLCHTRSSPCVLEKINELAEINAELALQLDDLLLHCVLRVQKSMTIHGKSNT